MLFRSNLGILEFLLKNKRNGSRVKEISQKLKLSVYGVKVLLEAAISLEMVLIKDEKYFLTKTGYFIISDELTRINMNFTHDVNYLGMNHLEESIKHGRPEGLKVFGEWSTIYEGLSELPDQVRKSWFVFDHYYSDQAFPELLEHIESNKPEYILDVGGNTGKFSIFCAKNIENVHMTILDLPGQINEADINIKDEGLADRISTHSIDLLNNDIPFPKGHNIVWMSQFLDCFSKEEILGLLRRSFDALDSNGALYILETYWDMQEFEASTYSLHATSLYFAAMANGNSQMYHSDDMIELLEMSNFYVDKIIKDIGVSHTLLICKKK